MTGQDEASVPETEAETGKLPFLPKRKKFLLPVILLLSVVLIGSVVGVLIGIVSIKNSAAFEATLTELEASAAVRQHVGLPIETGWLVIGKHDKQAGLYDLTFKITGPNGEAAVRSRCERTGAGDIATWDVTYLDIGVGGREGEVITLVGDPDFMPGAVE